MIRDDTRRSMLLKMDIALQRLGSKKAPHPSVISLTGANHNLLHPWAEA